MSSKPFYLLSVVGFVGSVMSRSVVPAEAAMEPWVIFLVVGVTNLSVALVFSFVKRRNRTVPNPIAQSEESNTASPTKPYAVVVSEWSESAITAQLQHLRQTRPDAIPHYIESLKNRWIVRQDDRTAEVRSQFLKRQIEQLKLTKDFQQTVDDLQMLALEKRKKISTLQFETEELESKREFQSEIAKLNTVKERKRAELEIAQLEKQIADLKAPMATSESSTSPEQQRANDKVACEARIQSLKAEKQNALKLDDEQERILKVNAIDDALQREMERWAKLL